MRISFKDLKKHYTQRPDGFVDWTPASKFNSEHGWYLLWQPEEHYKDFMSARPTIDYFDGLDWLADQDDGRGPPSHFCKINSPDDL